MTEPKPVTPADLWKACDTLTNPSRVKLLRDNGATEWVNLPSLYDLLVEAIDNRTSGGGVGKMQSKPPVATDALSLLVEIGTSIRNGCWNWSIKRTHDNAKDLRQIVSAVNTHNDPAELAQAAAMIRQWISKAKAICIADPNRSWRMHSAACRVCGSVTVPMFSDTGEPTRQPALVVYSEDGVIDRIECDYCGEILSGPDLAALVTEQHRAMGRLTA